MKTIARASPQLPLAVATSRAHSWVEVLQLSESYCKHVKHIHQPSTAELKHGLSRMSTSWGTSLFYYGIIKEICERQKPDAELVSCAMQRYRSFNNVPAMLRLLEEDVDSSSVDGARSTLRMASFTGMWEKALHTLESNATLRRNAADRGSLIRSLTQNGRWEVALHVIRRMEPTMDYTPMLTRPIIKRLSLVGEHQRALVLLSRVLASGYAFNTQLFSGIIRTLRVSNHWMDALRCAEHMGLYSAPKLEVRRNLALYHSLVDCLYEVDPYAHFSLAEMVADIAARTFPRGDSMNVPRKLDPFRLCLHADVFLRYRAITNSLSFAFSKAINLPRWYTRSLQSLIQGPGMESGQVLLLDTNFLLQCASRNLPLEHFYTSMAKQIAVEADDFSVAAVVIPFTVMQEAFRLIWNTNTHIRHAVRLLLWSRVVAMVESPRFFVLNLSSEFPSLAVLPITKLAYSKVGFSSSSSPSAASSSSLANASRNPDVRIINVALSLQHLLRQRVLNDVHATSVPEGTMLFSFVKYHVRRHNNAVKGIASTRLVMCTLDQQVSRVAHELGILTFPNLHSTDE